MTNEAVAALNEAGCATEDTDTPVWLITGCSSGLGRALAEHALGRGDRVAVTARDVASVTGIATTYGDRAFALRLDVTDAESVVAAVEACEKRFGRIDVLVNNAGYGYLAAIEEGADAAVRDLYDINVHGVVTVLKAVLPGMRARRSGRIVNISSFGGLAAFAATGYYHATKFALEGLSESLAAEVAPLGIAVTIAEPGGLRTQWAGTSMRQSPKRLADYEKTAGKRRSATMAVSGHQPGDPVRAAAAIAATLDSENPPLRLRLAAALVQQATSPFAGRDPDKGADMPNQGGADRRRYDPQARIEEVTAATERVITARGIEGLTHRAVAAEAGVPLGATTYHLASKDDLIQAALQRSVDRFAAYLDEWVAQRPQLTPDQLSVLLADVLLSSVAADRGQQVMEFELYVAAMRRPALRPIADRYMELTVNALSRYVDPLTARAASMAANGLRLSTLAGSEPPSRTEMEDVLRLILTAIPNSGGAQVS
ncbi:oxidoreductase [Streptomyces sp. NPDC006530]|uniref:oxidoreductase n=1 Tax=Streptomyces sp. NPDC006530 TaxID=3364750 RepID=UPI0036C3585E